MPFLGEKRVFLLKTKKGKDPPKKPTKKTNKEGLGPSEVANNPKKQKQNITK